MSASFEVVVVGGGLAGLSAAVAAARQGRQTCLVQDRPVLGGNSSSEVRVTPHGAAAFHHYARETGIISEALIEERARNHEPIFENGWTNSVWDMVLYDLAVSTENLTLYLNTTVLDVVLTNGGRRIESVKAHVANAETELTLQGRIFIDATGDGLVADRAGCEWRIGSEGKAEFGELHGREEDRPSDYMGNSIHFRTKDTGRDAPFVAPDWAVKHENPDYFYAQGRKPKDLRGGYWWIEIGTPYDTIYDAEQIRHELTRHTLGVWDWMKNRDPLTKEAARTYALDWIGQVPGKRESRRVMGEYLMPETDIQEKRTFEDEIAFGGWFLDVHTAGGLLAEHSEANSQESYTPYSDRGIASYVGPYGIPLRSLIARDVENLLLAGRDISATHAALGSIRVMGTCALLGQAAGTAAAVSLAEGAELQKLANEHIATIKQRLLRDGCFLLHTSNEDPEDLARRAVVTASSEATVRGTGPDSLPSDPGQDIWWDQVHPSVTERLDTRRGQLIAVGNERIDQVSVLLSNDSSEVQDVHLSISTIDHIWDYRVENGAPLAESRLSVLPGEKQWVAWDVGLTRAGGLPESGYVRLDVHANPKLIWHTAGRVEPGLVSMYEIGHGKMRTYEQGATMSFLVVPEQKCYSPTSITNGWTRPYRSPNLWRSNPQLPLDQWVELAWHEIIEIGTIEITFPGQLLREYHAYSPFYRDPECPKEYGIAVDGGDGKFRELIRVRDNYQRRRTHTLPPQVLATRVRIIVYATNGDPCAAIYEVRCYRR